MKTVKVLVLDTSRPGVVNGIEQSVAVLTDEDRDAFMGLLMEQQKLNKTVYGRFEALIKYVELLEVRIKLLERTNTILR